MKPRSTRRARSAWGALLTGAALVAGCLGEQGESIGGETHFLRRCMPETDTCGARLTCLSGICTAPCDEDTACGDLTAARCMPEVPGASSGSSMWCDVSCESEADCAALSARHRCEEGRCRAPELATSGTGGGASTGGSLGAGAAGPCALETAPGNEVLILGDSFFAASHQITAFLEEHARAAGKLGEGERYRDASRLIENTLAFGGNGIAAQYASEVAQADVRIVVMNGGGADVLLGSCETTDENCPLLSDAASAAQDLLSLMAADGVERVVYAFYPDSSPDVRAELDVLRPLVEATCAESPVPCAWLDLRETFEGHYAEYVQPDGLNPTAAGSQATAAAIWMALEAACVDP